MIIVKHKTNNLPIIIKDCIITQLMNKIALKIIEQETRVGQMRGYRRIM